MKALTSMKDEAKLRHDLWNDIAEVPAALAEQGITVERAIRNARYFKGQYDGLCEVLGLPAGRRS